MCYKSSENLIDDPCICIVESLLYKLILNQIISVFYIFCEYCFYKIDAYSEFVILSGFMEK